MVIFACQIVVEKQQNDENNSNISKIFEILSKDLWHLITWEQDSIQFYSQVMFHNTTLVIMITYDY